VLYIKGKNEKGEKMTKQDEIAILTKAADELGRNSYCGEWLREIIPQIENEMKCDIIPCYSMFQYRQDAERIIETAQDKAAAIIDKAKAEAETLKKTVDMRCKEALAWAKYRMEQAIDKLK
jgi:cell division septum initiation protein DivIVA